MLYYQLVQELNMLKEAHLYRQLPGPLESASGSRVVVGGREMLLLSSNNYLGADQSPPC